MGHLHKGPADIKNGGKSDIVYHLKGETFITTEITVLKHHKERNDD